MEQNCKSKSFRNQDALNEDRISKLPQDLLLQILSSLPTDIVIATSVLSKQWRSLWKWVPNLVFNPSDHYTSPKNVCRFLISHKAPVLETLRWCLKSLHDVSDLETVISIALARQVRELVLDFLLEECVRFPSELCSCNNTLEILILKESILLDFPSRVCFKSLRKLCLYYVKLTGEESFRNLLCGCPSLEDLVVFNTNVKTFTIAMPSLQRLTIVGWPNPGGKGGYVINVPSLKYLFIEGFDRCEFGVIGNVPKLVEAKLIRIYDITNEKSLVSLTSAKRLSLVLSPLQIKFPTGSIFYQLVCLELCPSRGGWRNLLSLMLDSSPKLQVLKLNRSSLYDNWGCVEWKKPKCVPDCLLFHLETFVWHDYKWKREAENEVATYILRNAKLLKKANYFTYPTSPKKLVKWEKKREMLDELASVVKSSNSCQLVFEEEVSSYQPCYDLGI